MVDALNQKDLKILVIGDVNGQYVKALEKASTSHKKNGPFDLCILLGNVFGSDESVNQPEYEKLINGNIEVALPVYFNAGRNGLPEIIRRNLTDGKICDRMFCMGNGEVRMLPGDFKLAYVEAMLDYAALPTLPTSKNYRSDSQASGASLQNQSTLDILFTDESLLVPKLGSSLSATIDLARSRIIELMKPRFYLSTSKAEFNRSTHALNHTTQVICLGDFRSSKKAFTLKKTNDSRVASIDEALENNRGTKRQLEDNTTESAVNSSSNANTSNVKDVPPDNYLCKICRIKGHYIKECPNKSAKQKKPRTQDCFLCLSNTVEKHLIASIGDECYVAAAKGPLLTTKSNSPNITFPGHMLIIPLSHAATLSSIDKSQNSTRNEVERYRIAIEQMYMGMGCCAVTFEISRSNGVHAFITTLPLPKSLSNEVESAFRSQAQADGLPDFEIADVANQDQDYIKVYLPKNVDKNNQIISLKVEPDTRIDFQFGRKVIANLLKIKDRLDWRKCRQTLHEEQRDVERFKEAFSRHDFSLS